MVRVVSPKYCKGTQKACLFMVHLSIIDPKEQTRHHSMIKISDWVITVMIAQNRDI